MKLEAGQRYLYEDDTDGRTYEIYIVGYDPIYEQWVASSKSWTMGLSHLDEEDYNLMSLLTQAESSG